MHSIRLIIFVFLTFFGSYFSANSQLVESKNGSIACQDFFFNSAALQNRGIKTIKVNYSTKKSLKPIKKNRFKTVHFTFDQYGRLTRKYNTKLLSTTFIDTIVEWRYYKDSVLKTIKKTGIGGIRVQSFFYNKKEPTTIIYGVSQSNSSRKINLSVSSYNEQRAEYLEYSYLNERDTLIKHKSVNSTVFKKQLIEWIDSTRKKVSISYPLDPIKNETYTFLYNDKGLCTSLEINNASSPTYRYTYQYSSGGFLMSFTKYDVDQNTSLQFSEIIYDENDGNLQAIITKDLYDNTIFIKKYTYTYYDGFGN